MISLSTSRTSQARQTVTGDGNVLVQGNGNRMEIGPPSEEREAYARINAESERSKDVPPSGPGPWPFIVWDTGDAGLRVWSEPSLAADQTGTVADRMTAWADCRLVNDYNPPSGRNVGPRWLRIRWPSTKPGNEKLNSAPNAPRRGWIYEGFTLPIGHNGAIPACPRGETGS